MKSFVISFLQLSFLSSLILFSQSAWSDGAFCANLVDPNAQPVAEVRPEDVGKDQAGKGLESDCGQIRSAIEQQMAARISQWQATGLQTPNLKSINDGYTKYKNSRDKCINGQMRAATVCLEGWSPDLANTAAQVNTAITGMGMAQPSGSNENCGKQFDIMKLAQAGITAYSAACGAAKAGCGLSCVGARKGLESMQKGIDAEQSAASCTTADPMCQESLMAYRDLLNQAVQSVKNELADADKKSIAGKASACTSKYGALAGSALAGLVGILNSMKQGKECEEKTSAAVADATAKCALEENAALPECICLLNPRTAGCSNAYDKMGADLENSKITTAETDKSNSIAKSNVDLGSESGLGIEHGARNPSGGAGLPGAPQGGGAGVSGGSSVGNGKGATGEGGGAGSGLSTDILSGAGGGGGGGGSWGRAGGGSANGGYRAYLPGGKQDPNRSMAGQQEWKREVTGTGGKSNFEKVKDRYRENKATLLGN